MSVRLWEVRTFYAANVEPPKKAGELARHDWQATDHAKDEDVEIAIKRKDIGVVQVRKVIWGIPQEWVTVKNEANGKG